MHQVTQIRNLTISRSGAKMLVHKGYVYIFGGHLYTSYDLNSAERMKIGEWRWNILPPMMETRASFGVYL
jgi:hypothetical protein